LKTIFIILIFACAFLALYEQSLAKPNPYIMLGAIAIFIFGLMRLMSKVPGKNEQQNTDDEV